MFAIAVAAVLGSLLGAVFQVRLILFLWATPVIGAVVSAAMFAAPHLKHNEAIPPLVRTVISQVANPELIVPMLVAIAAGALLSSLMAARIRAGLQHNHADGPKRRPGWRAAMEAQAAAGADASQAALMRRAAQFASKSPRQAALEKAQSDQAAMALPVLEIDMTPVAREAPDAPAADTAPDATTRMRSDTWSEDQPERRVRSRRRSALHGCLCFPGGRSANCTIQNLSVGGGRIRLKRDEQLPMAVVLLDFSNRLAHEAQVTWQEGETAGLQFSASYDLSNPRDERGHELRRLYDEVSTVEDA